MHFDGKPMDQPVRKEKPMTVLSRLAERARLAGATDAAPIDPADIVIEDDLAKLCRQPRCRNYGLSGSCPPHVGGPDTFRQWLKAYRQALAIKIDVPSEILLSEARDEVMQLLHEIAADVEAAAGDMGFPASMAFAGGSCKMLFCGEYPDCRVIDQGGRCRHPKWARPSMSGFGINVSRLMQSAGWQLKRVNHEADAREDATATVGALILIG
jgi:predicted metal-binding protein